jgi:transcriptional regulator with XRE-family HTH domain
MITKTNTFKNYRKRVNIPLHDVAHLLNIDISNLAKIEKGIREPSLHAVLLYHTLFKVPLLELFTEQYDELRSLWKRRSRTLVEHLQIEQPPKSKNRIAYINDFVNTLTKETYDK